MMMKMPLLAALGLSGEVFAHSCENDGTSPRGSNRPFDIPLFACFHYRCSPMTDCVRPVRTPVFKMRTKIYEKAVRTSRARPCVLEK